MPLYLAIIWLLNPWLGLVATVSAACLFLTGYANEVATRRAIAEANAIGGETMAALRTTLLGAETVRALGMREAVLRQWTTGNDAVLRLQARAGDRAGVIQAFARFERLGAQIAIVGVGAWLVIDHAITPGALIAAAIIVSRALAPAENLIGSWRSVAVARQAYRRILERLRGAVPHRGLRLPAPQGRLDVEGVSVILPGLDHPILHRRPVRCRQVVARPRDPRRASAERRRGSARRRRHRHLGPRPARVPFRVPAAGRAPLSGHRRRQHRAAQPLRRWVGRGGRAHRRRA
jgi:ABC-type protease/lipase transport system fused ATPase/permease subunit